MLFFYKIGLAKKGKRKKKKNKKNKKNKKKSKPEDQKDVVEPAEKKPRVEQLTVWMNGYTNESVNEGPNEWRTK